MPMERDIIRADEEYRKKFIRGLIIICLLCSLFGVMLIFWGLPRAQEYLRELDCKTAFQVIKVSIVFIFLSVLPFAVYFLRLGQRIIESEQLPPPGARVIRDKKTIRGAKAITRGRALIFLSVLMICLSLIGAFYVPYKMDKVIEKKAVISKSSDSEKIPVRLEP